MGCAEIGEVWGGGSTRRGSKKAAPPQRSQLPDKAEKGVNGSGAISVKDALTAFRSPWVGIGPSNPKRKRWVGGGFGNNGPFSTFEEEAELSASNKDLGSTRPFNPLVKVSLAGLRFSGEEALALLAPSSWSAGNNDASGTSRDSFSSSGDFFFSVIFRQAPEKNTPKTSCVFVGFSFVLRGVSLWSLYGVPQESARS